jgi:hypothetical protein
MLSAMASDRSVTLPPPLRAAATLDTHVVGAASQPGYRDFDRQAEIWWRKFTFRDNEDPFDRITQEALNECPALVTLGVIAGQQWTPRRGRIPTAMSEAHRNCWLSLRADIRERQILQASSAPGISRHHFGTDMDLFSVEGDRWTQAGSGSNQLGDEYAWMRANARRFGFIQPYTDDSTLRNTGDLGYMAERWHWSYYPIAQALLDFFQDPAHQSFLDSVIRAEQSAFATRHRAEMIADPRLRDPFSFVVGHWTNYVTNVAQTGGFPVRPTAPRR